MLITHQSCWGCGLSWIHFISCGANSACFARVSRGKPILRYIMSKFLKQKRKEKKENLRFCTCSNSIKIFFFYLFHLIFFSVCEQVGFYKSCNLIGSKSGQYSYLARSQQAVSGKIFWSFLGSLFKSPFNIIT